MARWLALIADFDTRSGWADWGCRSCSHWLAWRCGIAPSAAREHVRVARRLVDLPLLRAAFARGELSYSKVRAVTRLDSIVDEAALVELALVHTAAQLEKVVRATRRITQRQAQDAHERRFLVLDPQEDGTVSLRGRLTTEDAAVLGRALDIARESLCAEGPPAPPPTQGPEHTGANLLADALVHLADSLLTTGPAGRPTVDRHTVVVHVDAATLQPDAEGGATTDDGSPMAHETARRLCCDAGIVVHLERGGEPIAVGRRRRTIPPAIRRALRSRDNCCQFPGCTSTRWLDAHHIEHWADGGSTDLSNLVLLCGHHHKLVHEYGYRVDLTSAPADDNAKRSRGSARRHRPPAFRTPAGRRLEARAAPCRGDADALLEEQRRAGTCPDASTAVPGWAGERFDLGLSVEAVLGKLDFPGL